jgi:hypothetical protein
MVLMKKTARNLAASNRIPLPFDKAVEGLLLVKPTPTAAQRRVNNACMRKPAKPSSLVEMEAEMFNTQNHDCHKTTEEAECPVCARREELKAAIHAATRYGERQHFHDHN